MFAPTMPAPTMPAPTMPTMPATMAATMPTVPAPSVPSFVEPEFAFPAEPAFETPFESAAPFEPSAPFETPEVGFESPPIWEGPERSVRKTRRVDEAQASAQAQSQSQGSRPLDASASSLPISSPSYFGSPTDPRSLIVLVGPPTSVTVADTTHLPPGTYLQHTQLITNN